MAAHRSDLLDRAGGSDGVQEAAESGPIYLAKPYGRDDLIAAIAATLERRDEAVA